MLLNKIFPLSLLTTAGLCLPRTDHFMEKRSISQSLFNTFNLYQQYVAASFCPKNNYNNGKLTCPVGNCPLVQQATTTIVAGVHSPVWATTGYVAVDSTNQLIVMSFRGTQNLTNYFADVLLPLTDVSSICSGCQAFYGFWEAWLDAKTVVTNAVNQAHIAHSSYKIVLSGHSFGAAIATLATADLRKSGLSIDMYTLAAPRVCNQNLANYLTNTSPSQGANYLLEHLDDPVPLIPPTPPYYHPSPSYDILKGNNLTVAPSDITINPGIGASTTKFDLSIDLSLYGTAHVWYFQDVTQCYPSGIPIGLPQFTCTLNPLPTCTLAS